MDRTLLYGLGAGIVAYLMSKKDTVQQPANNILNNNLIITPTIILPDPSTVVNPNPVVSVDPINVNPIPQLSGNGILIAEDFNVNSMQDLINRGWQYIWNPGYGSQVGLENHIPMDIAPDPAGSGRNVLRMIYDTDQYSFDPAKPGTCNYWALPDGSLLEDGFHGKIAKSFGPVKELFARYYVYYATLDPSKPSNFMGDCGGSTKQHYINPAGAGIDCAAVVGLFYHNTTFDQMSVAMLSQWQTCGAGSLYPGSQDVGCTYGPVSEGIAPLSYGRWHCIEYHMKYNDIGQRNGEIDIWTNGVLTVHSSNVWWTDNPASTFNLLQIYRQGAINQLRYERDYVMATSRIGP